MEKAFISSKTKKGTFYNMFRNSVLIRLSILFLSLTVYMLFVSPYIEQEIQDLIVKGIRYQKQVTLNHLTPIHSNVIYAQEYDLNTLNTKDSLKKSTTITDILTEDARVVAMERFLADYNSPMTPYAKVFIEQADRYGLDWRLVASISGVESAFGNISPRNTNNGWGWRGINPNEGGWSIFPTWGAGITEVTRGLAQGYGVTLTPFQIEPTYCPPCGQNPAHAWANGVTRFMNELSYYVNNLDKVK
jgi:hypothetical protein